MKKFGTVKSKILSKLTECYSKNDKKTIKKIISLIKENVDFKELYLLYEDVENKYFQDKETAESYVIELGRSLNGKINLVSETMEKLDKVVGHVETKDTTSYNDLDSLIQEDNLLNIETKVRAKIDLFKHLTKKKDITESTSNAHTTNENLLLSVLTNNFNVLYNNTLSEQDRDDLKSILSMTQDEIDNKVNELKENINNKIDSLFKESIEVGFRDRLSLVREQVKESPNTKYSYYKLKELEKGI